MNDQLKAVKLMEAYDDRAAKFKRQRDALLMAAKDLIEAVLHQELGPSLECRNRIASLSAAIAKAEERAE